MNSSTLSAPEVDILLEATEDAVGLWSVAWRFRELNDAAAIRRATDAVLRRLLIRGLIEPGELKWDGRFEPWETSADETLRRVEKLWNRLGRAPDIGEGPWFVATAEGQRAAKSL